VASYLPAPLLSFGAEGAILREMKMTMKPAKPNIQGFILGGLTAGLLINAVEYLVHGVFLDQ
jgi:hypothetical protein